MRHDHISPLNPRHNRRGSSPVDFIRQVLAYCGGMSAGALFGLGSVVLVEALTYPKMSTFSNLAALPPAALGIIALTLLSAVFSASLIPFLCARWVVVRLLPRVGWTSAAVVGGLAGVAGLLTVDFGLYDMEIFGPSGGIRVYSLASTCGAVAGLVYRALGGFREF